MGGGDLRTGTGNADLWHDGVGTCIGRVSACSALCAGWRNGVGLG